MSNDEMDRAIAEVVGWKRYDINLMGNDGHFLYRFKDTDLLLMDHELPKFSTDLNAMHEAEKALTDHWDGFHFRNHLCNNIHATARQRAEAFLKTIGKWRDE